MRKQNQNSRQGRGETSTNNQELVQQLIAKATCSYKPDGKNECGRKHGQLEAGKPISLFEARNGLELKGVICNRCITQAKRAYGNVDAYSFVPIAEAAGQIAFFSQKKQPDGNSPSTPHGTDGGDGNKKPDKKDGPSTPLGTGGGDGNKKPDKKDGSSTPLKAGAPTDPKPETAEGPKDETAKHRPGDGIRAKFTKGNTSASQREWFEAAVRRAVSRKTRITILLASSPRGRLLLRDIGLEELIAKISAEQIASFRVANQLGQERSRAKQLGLVPEAKADGRAA